MSQHCILSLNMDKQYEQEKEAIQANNLSKTIIPSSEDNLADFRFSSLNAFTFSFLFCRESSFALLKNEAIIVTFRFGFCWHYLFLIITTFALMFFNFLLSMSPKSPCCWLRVRCCYSNVFIFKGVKTSSPFQGLNIEHFKSVQFPCHS